MKNLTRREFLRGALAVVGVGVIGKVVGGNKESKPQGIFAPVEPELKAEVEKRVRSLVVPFDSITVDSIRACDLDIKFMASGDGTVIRSLDGGKTWAPIN